LNRSHRKALALEPNSAGRAAATSGFARTRTRALASRILATQYLRIKGFQS
jgi:hypothetical protein